MISVPFEPPTSLPRSAAYPVDLMAEATMGPNVLWLAESLTGVMTLAPEMRVLDLGCGRALSSIFLAREFGVTVTAADLWISPGENAERLQREGVADRVTPIRAEAHDLPSPRTPSTRSSASMPTTTSVQTTSTSSTSCAS